MSLLGGIHCVVIGCTHEKCVFLENEKRELREVQGLPILTPLHTWPLCEAGRWMLDCTFGKVTNWNQPLPTTPPKRGFQML